MTKLETFVLDKITKDLVEVRGIASYLPGLEESYRAKADTLYKKINDCLCAIAAMTDKETK